MLWQSIGTLYMYLLMLMLPLYTKPFLVLLYIMFLLKSEGIAKEETLNALACVFFY